MPSRSSWIGEAYCSSISVVLMKVRPTVPASATCSRVPTYISVLAWARLSDLSHIRSLRQPSLPPRRNTAVSSKALRAAR
ncbi:hypothetical protein D3C79_842160 [compost metagenome]